MRHYDVFLIILAILALFSLGAGGLVIGLAFSGIGLPLAILIWVLPSLAVILGLPRILDRLLFSRFLSDDKSWAAALVAALAVLVAVPMIANHRQSAQVAGLLAGDHDDLARPLPNQIYAVPSQQPTEDCTDFCQRLLLTGQATAVFVLQHDAPVLDVPDPATPGTLWQIKDQPTCPPVTLPVDAGHMQIKAEPGNNAPQADLLIAMGIAAGHCLIATASNLAAADTVIVDTTLSTQRYSASFSLGADFIGAKRYAVWTKTNQKLTEQARWTYVSAAPMFPLAVPMANPQFSGDSDIGFPRMNAKGNANDPGFDQFADQILGLRLSLMDVPNPVSANGEDPLIVALRNKGPLAANIQQLARGRIDAISDAQSTTPEDRALFLALWADPRIDLKARYDGAARILLRDAPSDFAGAVAKIGFARMDSLLLPDPHRANLSHIEQIDLIDRVGPIKQQIGLIGFVLAQLPDAALQPYGPALFALANDRENRTEPYQLLIRLSSFGDLGARALVDLLADAKFVDNGDPFYYNFRQNAYSAAMTGLCRMGPRAASVLPDLLKLVKKGEVIMSYGEGGQLTATVLIRLGQPVDTILGLSGHEKYPMTKQDIDLAQQRANQPDVCQY